MKPKLIVRPAWVIAFILMLAVLIVGVPGISAALGKLFGNVPSVGLVENPSGMRMLSEPASVTRDGVTVTVTQALVYPDHVQLVYEVIGIAPENDGATFSITEMNEMDDADFCGPASSLRNGYLSDGDPQLRLPNGAVIERAFGADKYPENIFAMKPAYEAAIPADVTELTMTLKCIPWARLGAVPENWEVPFKLEHGIGEIERLLPANTTAATPNTLEQSPAPATITVDGMAQTAAVGTYCWNFTNEAGDMGGACLDTIGIPTVREPLDANTALTVELFLPYEETPDHLSLSIFPAAEENEISLEGSEYHLWNYIEGETRDLALQPNQQVQLELEPGMYVFSVFASWETRGNVYYGFLINAQ